MGYDFIKNKQDAKSILNILNISIIIHFIISILQKNYIVGGFVNGVYKATHGIRVISTFNGPYELATYFTLMLPLYIVKLIDSKKDYKKIIQYIIFIIMIFVGIYLTESRTSLIIALIVLITIPILKKKDKIIEYIKYKKALSFIIVIIVLLLLIGGGILLSKTGRFKTLDFSSMCKTIKISWNEKDFERYQNKGFYVEGEENTDLSFKIRINKWMALIDGIIKSPIYGLGLSISKEACDGNYIRIFAESGILGLLTWVFLIIIIIKNTKKNKDDINILAYYGMIVLLLTAILIDVFEASKIMMLYWLILGAAYSYQNINNENKEKVEEQSKIKCSIAMAVYNGEKYIKEQIDSILKNMSDNDELIISDDGSKDDTLKIISKYNDERIKLIEGPHKGVKQNFANAIDHAKGKYIFLSDQDDIWMENKIELVLKTFEDNNVSIVIHDAEVIDENLEVTLPSFFEYRNSGKGIIKNIYKNTYIGCCMAFKADLKKYILPIPNNIEMHDQWIGILGESKGDGSIYLKEKLIQYRRHSNNVSQMKHYGIAKMIKNRVFFIINYLIR